MLEVVGQTLQATVNLLDVRAKLLLRHAERSAVALLWKAGAGVCLGVAVLLGLAAGAIAAAPVWGWPVVLGVGAGILVIAGLIAWVVAASMLRPHPDAEGEELEREAVRWTNVLHPPKVASDESAGASGPNSPGHSPFGRVDDALKSLQRSARDPVTVASAAFAVAAILGPFRALRTAAKVAAAASAARSVARAVRETGGHHP